MTALVKLALTASKPSISGISGTRYNHSVISVLGKHARRVPLKDDSLKLWYDDNEEDAQTCRLQTRCLKSKLEIHRHLQSISVVHLIDHITAQFYNGVSRV